MVRIFVGVAWPYANGPFHIGHLAGAYLPADIFARYHRLRGHEVLMVSGSDMHGTPILVTAERERATPEAVARRFDAVNRTSFQRLGFSFDLFTHTHTVVHERTVQELFLGLFEHRLIDKRTEENAYCPTHRRFLPDRYLRGTCPHCGFDEARGDECDRCGRVLEPRELRGPRCSECASAAEFRPTEHLYLALDRLAPRLAEFVNGADRWRGPVAAIARNFLAEGLRATPITRDLDWGVPIPLEGFAAKRFYVWFDALIGYLSASREWAIRAGRPEAWRRYWDPTERVRQYFFIGRDNIFHHTLLWPAIALGVGDLQLPYDVPANAWLLVGGTKLSKSRGPGDAVLLPALLDRYPPDVIRFYAAQLAPQNHDTEFRWSEFHQLADEVLANQWGNLVQRVLVLARDRGGGRIPAPGPAAGAGDGPGVRLEAAHRRISEELEAVHLKEALDLVFAEIREANRRFHDAKPWAAEPGARDAALHAALWTIRAAATWLLPFLPFSSERVFAMLGEEPPAAGAWDRALDAPAVGRELGSIAPLFPKSSEPPSAPGPDAPAPGPGPGPTPAPAAGGGGPAPFAVRAAVVRSVELHPSADRLYVVRLDVGEATPRTVVAGLKPFYTVAELTGRRVALLANLEPRTIRRVTSQGMLLAADVGERADLLTPPDDVAPGLYVEGTTAADRSIAYAEFERTPLLVGRVAGPAGPGRVAVDVGEAAPLPADGTWPEGTRVVLRRRDDAPEGIIVSFGPGLPLSPPASAPVGARIR